MLISNIYWQRKNLIAGGLSFVQFMYVKRENWKRAVNSRTLRVSQSHRFDGGKVNGTGNLGPIIKH